MTLFYRFASAINFLMKLKSIILIFEIVYFLCFERQISMKLVMFCTNLKHCAGMGAIGQGVAPYERAGDLKWLALCLVCSEGFGSP